MSPYIKQPYQGGKMHKNTLWKCKVRYFIFGILAVLWIVTFMGNSNSAPHYGRYQLSSWGTAFGDFSGGCGAFIIDTATGETKTAYMYIYGMSDGASILKDNLGKAFYDIK